MALMKEELDLKDEEIVIVIRRAGQRKPEFVMQDEQTDLALRSDAWRERAKDTLVAGLRRPDSDQPCAFALLGCVGALGMTLRVSGERTDAVWDAVAHFLARPRTFDEIVAVIARPCACDAGAFNTRLHRAGRARFAPLVDMIAMPFAWAVIELARILAFAMELCRDRAFVLWRTAKRVRTAEEAGTRLEWPQRWEQLFPHGVEDSFRGVAVWFGMAGDRTFYGALFQVVTGYMVQAHGVILPFLVNSRYIAAAVVRYIDDEVRNWGRHFVPIEARLQDASIHMGSLMEFLDLLGSASLVERLKLLQLESGKLLVACDRAMTVSDEQRDAVERLYTKKHARHFKEQHIRFFVIANATRFADAVALERRSITATPAGQLADALTALERQQHCAAPGCTQTFLHRGARFRYCAGCRRVPFCSVQCAVRAWRHPELPHRAVCGDIRAVCHRLGIRRTHVEERLSKLKTSGRPLTVEPEGPRIVAHFKELQARHAAVRSDEQWESQVDARRSERESEILDEAREAAQKETILQNALLVGPRSMTEIPENMRAAAAAANMDFDAWKNAMVRMSECVFRQALGMKNPRNSLFA